MDVKQWRAVPTQDRRWPFVESPGEFTKRLHKALGDFDLLGAVRNVLIENPPEIAVPTTDAPTLIDPAELAALRQRLAEQQREIETFRAAQKACETCDAPTAAEVERLLARIAELERKPSLREQMMPTCLVCGDAHATMNCTKVNCADAGPTPLRGRITARNRTDDEGHN